MDWTEDQRKKIRIRLWNRQMKHRKAYWDKRMKMIIQGLKIIGIIVGIICAIMISYWLLTEVILTNKGWIAI